MYTVCACMAAAAAALGDRVAVRTGVNTQHGFTLSVSLIVDFSPKLTVGHFSPAVGRGSLWIHVIIVPILICFFPAPAFAFPTTL